MKGRLFLEIENNVFENIPGESIERSKHQCLRDML